MASGLQYDPVVAVAELRRSDSRLAELIDLVGPFTLRPRRPLAPFPALLRSIIYQQLHGKAAASIHARVLALFPGRGHPSAADFLALPDADLRAAGLSRNKLRAARDLAEKVQEGSIPSLAALRRMDDETVIERLLVVHGIGRWTAQMLLIFTLGRPDVLPLADFGVRKGFLRLYGDGRADPAERLRRKAEAWQPWRSVASWYLWRAAELPEDSVAGLTQVN